VNDIDLMVGLLLEKHSEGAIFGPTTRCLIADGFYLVIFFSTMYKDNPIASPMVNKQIILIVGNINLCKVLILFIYLFFFFVY